MNHSDWIEKLFLMRDGELPETERPCVQKHKDGCAQCREIWTRWERLPGTLFRSGAQESEAFVQRVLARLEEPEAEARSWFPLAGWRIPAWGLSFAALALIVNWGIRQPELSTDELLLTNGPESVLRQVLFEPEATGADDILDMAQEDA